jgi:VWFA-related protein
MPGQEAQPVFRSVVSLVRVDTEVLDSEGSILTGLRKEDFRVLDEGSEQPLVSVSFEEEPLDLILLFDAAGSMRSQLLRVVRAVELGFHELKKGDRVCVMAFRDDAFEVAPFTADLDAVNQTILLKVLRLPFSGHSHAPRAASSAAVSFRQEPKSQRRRAILAITDQSLPPGAEARTAVRDLWQADAVFSELELRGAPVTQVRERAGSRTAEKSGGATVVAGDPGASFQQAVRLLRRRYTLYYASPGGQAGTERSVEVRLTPAAEKRYPGARVRSRTGYLVSTSP